ncbi:MAG TPA: cobalt ECF transporter T component CbiQ [Candidatus Omnitrophica bacterium]|nr:cobalt ECF transporter T component CbiQ [Candidatus Omnitrophota bacterium]
MNDIFSDYFAQRDNFLTRIDARLKAVFVIMAIILTLFSQRVFVPWCIILLVPAILLSIKVPVKIIIHRICAPLGIALSILCIQTFYHGGTPIWRLHIGVLSLTAYAEGLRYGYAMVLRIMASTSWVLFLSMTTSLPKLLEAGLWFKLPPAWIEVCFLTYRYIFVLLEDAKTVFDAQKVRLGYTAPFRSLRSLGVLAGTIVIKAYDQSIATYEAMMLRGYKNINQDLAPMERLKTADVLAVFIFGLILIALALNS